MKYTIKCELCGLECKMQVPSSHLRAAHNMTTQEYRALGYDTLSEARLHQLQQSDFAQGKIKRLYGEDHPNWKGGHIARSGYKLVSRMGKNCLYEHRLVAQEMIGRPLQSDEVVHHIDGNRSNNDPSNLVVMKRGEHDKIKDSTRAYFHTNEDCEEAAVALRNLGWSKTRIERALRIHHNTLSRWLDAHSDKLTKL